MTEETKERNAAGKALFQIQFMSMMLMAGREEEASRAYAKAYEILQELEIELDREADA